MAPDLRDFVRDVPDFPVPGILFRDITPLLGNAEAFREAVEAMTRPWRDHGIDYVAAMEARGFMFAAPMALAMGTGFVPIRKAGKLPGPTRSVSYRLEYRDDELHIHKDAVPRGARVLVVDDVIATGGTAAAVVELIRDLGGDVAGLEFLIELSDLGGRALLGDCQVHSVITY
jgi:adenine phosphoribosyltransferase